MCQYNLSFTLLAKTNFGMPYLSEESDSGNVFCIKVGHVYGIKTPEVSVTRKTRARGFYMGPRTAILEHSGRHNFFVWTFFGNPTSPVCLECRDL